MARPLRIQYPGAYYYVMCRGNQDRMIFVDDMDRNRFLTSIAESIDTYRVVLYAYIMMPDHFHLIVQTLRSNLSEFMRRFNICYTSWFNHHHNYCGHLFHGRYKSVLIEAESYLLEVSRYLHLNVVQACDPTLADSKERWRFLTGYRWSSLPGYIDEKQADSFVFYDEIISLAGGRNAYHDYILSGLQHGASNPFEKVKHQVILGNHNFVERIKAEYLNNGSRREQPSYRSLTSLTLESDRVMAQIAEVMDLDTRVLSNKRGSGLARGIAAELLYRYSGLAQSAIGNLLGGIDYCAVSQLRRRLKNRMTQDEQVASCFQTIENRVKNLIHR